MSGVPPRVAWVTLCLAPVPAVFPGRCLSYISFRLYRYVTFVYSDFICVDVVSLSRATNGRRQQPVHPSHEDCYSASVLQVHVFIVGAFIFLLACLVLACDCCWRCRCVVVKKRWWGVPA